MPKPLTTEMVCRSFAYDSDNGLFTWRVRPVDDFDTKRAASIFNVAFAGQPAFTAVSAGGYRVTRMAGKLLLAHRVAWVVMTGDWPAEQIDHINGNRSDNRWHNLRAVDHSGNCRNAGLPRRNTSGRIGVCWDKRRGRWVAQVRIFDRQINLGRFDSFEDACTARAQAERRHGFHPNHGRRAAQS